MDMEKVKEFTEKINAKVAEAINSSDLMDFFEDHGLVEKALRIDVLVNLHEIRNNDMIKDEELRNSLRELPGEMLTVTCCCPKPPIGCVYC